jgi:fido (protein-threonine AMPylation protein)
MAAFLSWYADNKLDPVIKAALAHLWFVTIHPFDDGNGRIARANRRYVARAVRAQPNVVEMSLCFVGNGTCEEERAR